MNKKALKNLVIPGLLIIALIAGALYVTARVFYERGQVNGLNNGYKLCQYETMLMEKSITTIGDRLDSVRNSVDSKLINIKPKK